MAKNICVIGVGYVGLATAIGLADFGNYVIAIDIDQSKIQQLQNGNMIIYEQGLQELLTRNTSANRLKFTNSLKDALDNSEVVFIAVGTPENGNGDGAVDIQYVENAVNDVIQNSNSYKVLVIKSTVPVGYNRKVNERIKKANRDMDVVSNPEFLREGKAVYDFFHPDRVVIGTDSEKAKEIMRDVYRTLNRINVPFLWTDWESAELIKYASNGFLAIKIAYINQLACLAEQIGADIISIAKGMGMDGRIGPKFLHAGPGYGGSCFPKDTKALSAIAHQFGVPITIIDAVIEANKKQKMRIVERLKKRMPNISGKTIGILGLAFKAETDDIRESPAIDIVNELLKLGAIVKVHDPQAMHNFKEKYGDKVSYCNNEYEASKDADALLILTEWNEYRSLDLRRIKSAMKSPYIFDTRNVLDRDELNELGFSFDLIGQKTMEA